MTVVQKIDRRQAQRFQAAFDIRFSINGGPEMLSNTLNFTSRSLAIRSEAPAAKGDHVSIFFSGLPALDGAIARVFPEGFAVVLSESSLCLMTHGRNQANHTAPDCEFPAETTTSPFIRARSTIPSRVLITSGAGYAPGFNRHFLSIITANPAALDNINTIWISADGARWTASALRFERRNNRGHTVMALNDWQAHMGAAYGLKISIMNNVTDEWSLEIDADYIADHLGALQAPIEYKIAVNA